MGTRAKWMNLYGKIGDEEVSLVICDHSKNQNYPTYWHARAYGLFSANPLGVKDFTKGKKRIEFLYSGWRISNIQVSCNHQLRLSFSGGMRLMLTLMILVRNINAFINLFWKQE